MLLCLKITEEFFCKKNKKRFHHCNLTCGKNNWVPFLLNLVKSVHCCHVSLNCTNISGVPVTKRAFIFAIYTLFVNLCYLTAVIGEVCMS